MYHKPHIATAIQAIAKPIKKAVVGQAGLNSA